MNVLLIFITLLAYLSPFISPSIFWPLSFFGLFFPGLLLMNLLFVIGWLLGKKRYFIFSLLILIMGWGYIRSFVGIGWGERPQTTENSIKLTTFNAHSIVPKKEINLERKKAYESFASLIAGENSQVFCFQEVPNLKWSVEKCRTLEEDPIDPAYKVLQSKGSLGILTRLPVLETQSRYFNSSTNGYQWADLRWNDRQIIRVFNLHLESNGITGMTERVKKHGNFQDKKTWESIKGIMRRYKRASQKRAEQVEEIAGAIRQSPHPVIICGDFNDVPVSYTYRILSSGLQDTFKAKGRGFATTYTGPLPALRIDYIFVAPHFKISSFYSGQRNFSDHKPVSTIIHPRL